MRPRSVLIPAILSGILAALSGCAHLGYYAQAVRGQFQIIERQRPIGNVLDDRTVPAAVKAKLVLVQRLRRFAVKRLALPDNGSYRRYADLGRRYVVWNVFATPELSLEPVKSCFPVVGCLNYRGYFEESAARTFARKLRDAGDDVFVGGVVAYSTLGWFDDPVLNTMLWWDDAHIAKYIFHELAHQRLYVRDDSDFNEAFATAVAAEGWRRWQAEHGGASDAARTESNHDAEFTRLLLAAKARLRSIYRSGLSTPAKRAAKAVAFTKLRSDYGKIRVRWGGDAGYDRWMDTDLNNAKIAAVATYYDDIPAFTALLEAVKGDMAAFYRLTARVGSLPLEPRRLCLAGLIRSGPAYLAECGVGREPRTASLSH